MQLDESNFSCVFFFVNWQIYTFFSKCLHYSFKIINLLFLNDLRVSLNLTLALNELDEQINLLLNQMIMCPLMYLA